MEEIGLEGDNRRLGWEVVRKSDLKAEDGVRIRTCGEIISNNECSSEEDVDTDLSGRITRQSRAAALRGRERRRCLWDTRASDWHWGTKAIISNHHLKIL